MPPEMYEFKVWYNGEQEDFVTIEAYNCEAAAEKWCDKNWSRYEYPMNFDLIVQEPNGTRHNMEVEVELSPVFVTKEKK